MGTPTTVDLDGLVSAVETHDGSRRCLVAVVGPPGAGKSTVADVLVERLNSRNPTAASVLPMDGYHYDDRVLDERGLRARKGSPDTFDVGGLSHMLERLRDNRETEVAVPVFDRDLEIARAGARLIPQAVRFLVVEGNYLLLRQAPWSNLRRWFDLTVTIAVPEAELKRRLVERWAGYGLSAADIERKVEGNDLPNGRFVMTESAPSDYLLTVEWRTRR